MSIQESYPIGTRLRLLDDDPGVVHEVYGYERSAGGDFILFKNGIKLNILRLELIEEVV